MPIDGWPLHRGLLVRAVPWRNSRLLPTPLRPQHAPLPGSLLLLLLLLPRVPAWMWSMRLAVPLFMLAMPLLPASLVRVMV